MGGTFNIVTGTPFAGVTFNTGTSTFTITGGDYTLMFNTGAILTVLNTSTSNDGYYETVSSTFSGGDTIVTVASYNVGTSYPGTVPFVSSPTGLAIWFYAGSLVITYYPGTGNGANGRATPVTIGSYGSTTWGVTGGPSLAFVNSTNVVQVGSDYAVVDGSSLYRYDSSTSPWTRTATTLPASGYSVGTISGPDTNGYYAAFGQDNSNNPTMLVSTDLLTWTDIGEPEVGAGTVNTSLFSDGTSVFFMYTISSPSVTRVTKLNGTGTGWTTPVTVTGSNAGNYPACVIGTNDFAIVSNSSILHTTDGGGTWSTDVGSLPHLQYSGLEYDSGTWYLHPGSGDDDIYTSTGGAPSVLVSTPSNFSPVAVGNNLGINTLIKLNGTIIFNGVFNYTKSAYVTQATYSGYISMDSNTHLWATPSWVMPNNFVNSYPGSIAYIGGSYFLSAMGEIFKSSTLSGTFTPQVQQYVVLDSLTPAASNGSSTLVLIGNNGHIVYSTDTGSTWSVTSTPIDQNPSSPPIISPTLSGIVNNGSIFVVVGDSAIATSSDGITWSDHSIPSEAISLVNVAWSPTLAIFAAAGFGNTAWAYSSDNTATSWTASLPFSDANINFGKLRWLNDRFVSVGYSTSNGPLFYSTNGSTVTAGLPAVSADNISLNEVAYGNSAYVAVGYDNANSQTCIYYSTDGSTWSLATTSGNLNFHSVVYANNKFVAIGTDQGTSTIASATSTDGITWTNHSTAMSGLTPQDMDWNGTSYIATLSNSVDSANASVIKSSDGITWTTDTTAGTIGPVDKVLAVNGATIATSSYGLILKQ